MSLQRIIGIVLLGAAVVLLIIGITSSNSFADQLSTTFTGRPTQNTMWYFIGAGVAVAAGLVLIFARFKKR